MAWNQKALKGMNSQAKRHIDRFDLEAEAEGGAICIATAMRPHNPKGKRTAKDQNRESRGAQINTNRVVKRYVA